MCIVIDINTLAMVFNETNGRFNDFQHLRDWISDGLGVVVFGGTKYKSELAETARYMRLINRMRDAGQAVSVRDQLIDDAEIVVLEKTQGTDCDDQHIIALLGATRCPLLCSVDSRSYPYVKNRGLYPKGAPSVKIFTSDRNRKLLVPTSEKTRRFVENCA